MERTQKHQNGIQPVILCGGIGSRLWPVSRKTMPKQFTRLVSENSMLQDTALAVHPDFGFDTPMLVTNRDFGPLIEAQLREIGMGQASLVLEPEARNTAPAIALAAFVASQKSFDTVLLVMPSDHVMGDHEGFLETVAKGEQLARQGHLVTFGMKAKSPETGYGYIARGRAIANVEDGYRVSHFVEKPSREVAEDLLRSEDYHWNSGMFMFTVGSILEAMAEHCPRVLYACFRALKNANMLDHVVVPNRVAFHEAESISIDYAIMEKAQNTAMVSADFGWSDVGTWNSLAEAHKSDASGNHAHGKAVMRDCENTYIHGSERLVAAIGVRDLVIVETPDAILVAPKDRSQDIKELSAHAEVARLEASSKAIQPEESPVVHRPWGSYESLHGGEKHQVKHIVVKPGERLSYQYHHFRAEHWVVVSGIAEAVVGKDTVIMGEADTVFIPIGAPHRLRNPGDKDLHLIEVQYGSYLGEDDIVRIEDDYGRVPDTTEEATEEASTQKTRKVSA